MNTKVIAWLTGILTLSLASFAFVLSFNSLTDLAAKHGVSIPPLFPLVVEAGVIIFSLNALYRSIYGESAKWQWALIIGSSLFAGAFNVLHAEADLISRAMAAMPSLFLLLSFETFLGQVKHGVKLSTVVKSIADKQTEFDSLVAQYDNLQSQHNILSQQIEQDTIKATELKTELAKLRSEKKAEQYQNISNETKQQALQILQERSDISGAELGRLLGRSDTLGRRLKNELLPLLNGHQNNGQVTK